MGTFLDPNFETIVQRERFKTEKVLKDDFAIVDFLGKGGFGKVFLVKKLGTKEYYAMKTIKKAKIKDCDLIEQTMNERKILELVDSPFIVKLLYSFQTKQKLFLVIDYCPGGEFYF